MGWIQRNGIIWWLFLARSTDLMKLKPKLREKWRRNVGVADSGGNGEDPDDPRSPTRETLSLSQPWTASYRESEPVIKVILSPQP